MECLSRDRAASRWSVYLEIELLVAALLRVQQASIALLALGHWSPVQQADALLLAIGFWSLVVLGCDFVIGGEGIGEVRGDAVAKDGAEVDIIREGSAGTKRVNHPS